MNGFNDASHPEQVTVPNVPHLTLELPTDIYEGFGREHYDLDEQIEDLLELVKFVYSELRDRVLIVSGLSAPHGEQIVLEGMPPPVTEESLARNEIEYTSWLTIFPLAFVETYGKETLLSAPAWHSEELDDGAVLLVAYKNPAKEGETKPIDEHLGLDSPAVKDHYY